MLASFFRLLLCPCSRNGGLTDSRLILPVLVGGNWTHVLLVQGHSVGHQDLHFFERSGPSDNFSWFDPWRPSKSLCTLHVMFESAPLLCRLGVSSKKSSNPSLMLRPSFSSKRRQQLLLKGLIIFPVEETTRIASTRWLLPSVPIARTIPLSQITLPMLHLVDRPVKTVVRLTLILLYLQLPRSRISTFLSKYPTCVSSDSESPEQKCSCQLYRMTCLSKAAALPRFIVVPSGGFAGTPAGLACQVFNLMNDHCARREYAIRPAKEAWADHFHLPVRRNMNSPLRSLGGSHYHFLFLAVPFQWCLVKSFSCRYSTDLVVHAHQFSHIDSILPLSWYPFFIPPMDMYASYECGI